MYKLSLKSKYPPHPQYWTCQLIGWMFFYITQVYFIYAFGKLDWKIAVFYFIVTITGLLLSHLYRNFIIHQGWLNLNIPKILIRILPASVIFSLIWISFNELLDYLFNIVQQSDKQKISWWTIYFAVLFNTSVIMLVWSLFYFAFHFFKTFKQSEIEKWKLDAAFKEAELIALKAQINPHFIFNSLNNIRSLVIENPEKARDMITRLSDLLRYSIQLNTQEKVTLGKELEIVEDYLQLESIQFEERLKYRFDVDKEAFQIKIPPMVIQILVENAIKHGIANLPQGGEIIIKTLIREKLLNIEIINTGQIYENLQGSGLGLKNASQRLQLLSNSLENIELKNCDNNQVSAKFSIPVLNE